jgi:hypothetical protein
VRDRARNRLRSDTIAALLEPHGAHDIHRQRAIHPPGQWASVIDVQIVATGQHCDPRPCGGASFEHAICECAAGMSGDDDVVAEERHRVERLFPEDDPPIESRPYRHERIVKLATGGRQRRVNDERVGRRVIENQQDVREEPMSGSEIDDAAATEDPAHAPRHLPRLVQFFARQATGVAHGARQTIEERVCRKPPQIAVGEAVLSRDRKRRVPPIAVRPCAEDGTAEPRRNSATGAAPPQPGAA